MIRQFAPFLVLLLWILSGGALLAQTEDDPALTPEAYAEWERVATRAEGVLAAQRASNLSLEQLRSQIADWRSRFQEGQNANADRIATLESQINALGPVPEEGASEPEEIAQRRATLTEQMQQLRVPVRTAEEAFTRADGLIRQIDRVIRERQANALLELGSSPLIPSTWTDPLEKLGRTKREIWNEVLAAWGSDNQRAALRSALPKVLLLVVVGLVLLARGRAWSVALVGRLLSGVKRRTRAVTLSMLVSIGQMVLPYLGLLALVEAAYATGFFGLVSNAVLSVVPMMGLTFLVARWLGGQAFPKIEGAPSLLDLDPVRNRLGRYYSNVLGLLLALYPLLSNLITINRLTDESVQILSFPLLVGAGFGLYWLSRLILIHSQRQVEEGEETPFRARILRLAGRAGIVLAILGPALAAIGYGRAGAYFTLAPVMSLALLALVGVLQRFTTELYAVFLGKDEAEAGEGLIPVLISFGLVLAALPVLALIWGARIADLTELWQRFLDGISVGGTRISPSNFLLFAAVFVLGYMLTRFIQGALKTSVLPKTRIDPGGQNAIVSGTGYVGIFLAAVIAISSAGLDLSNIAIVAGALSVGIGFGLQTIVSNFVSGIILLIERPVSEGDWIEVSGVHGTVRKIAVRATTIETFDRSEIIVPNSDLIAGQVTNYTKTNQTGRLIVHVGVAYGSDTRRIAEILQEVAEAHPLVILRPPPLIVFAGFGASSLDFEVRVILRDVNFILSVKTELHHAIAERFVKEGVEIPFPQQDLWLRNPQTLRDTGEGTA